MDWIGPSAVWLRGVLAQRWLEAWEPAIADTPDWALLAAGPAALLLIALVLRFTGPGPRASPANAHAKATLRPVQAQSREPVPAPQLAKTDEAPKPPLAVTPTPAPPAERRDAPATPAARATADTATVLATAATQTTDAPVRRASGVPDENEQERKARVFLSSTFRDMRAEREMLATDTFPSLKRKFRARGVEVQEVDLRWGVNEGDATLDVCLQAVRRCNWFVGLIGQRYGTTLEDEATVAQLGPDYPAVREGLGRSVTEIEILEGVLLNAKDDKQTLFFERDPAWLDTLNSSERLEYEEQDADAQSKLAELKTRIRERVGVMHAYASPQKIDAVFGQAMSATLEKAFPPIEGTDDPFMQEHRLHAAYARERLGFYVGGEDYLGQIDAWMAQDDAPPKIAVGASGGGKSTLIAHWSSRWARARRNDIVFAHYLGASPDSANPAALIRRLWVHLNRITGDDIAIPSPVTDLDDLRELLSDRLAQAAAFAAREKCFILIALDGLDKLSEEHRDLRWWPRGLPPRIKLLASSLDGKAHNAARERQWSELVVTPFNAAQQSAFIADTLKGWNKSDFPEARKRRVLGHPLASLPLFLKTILEELRVSAAHDVLDARLDGYLKAPDMPDLYARILAQFEIECGEEFVFQALSLIWASRGGLEEDEIVAITSDRLNLERGPAGLAWERLRNRLADNLRDTQGRVAFSHDYLRQAVEAIYLKSEQAKRQAHLVIADRFATREPDERQAEELPYQLRAAEAWPRLADLLLDLDRFELLQARGDTELLSFWLALKEHNVESLLCRAMEARSGEASLWSPDDAKLAVSISDFLRFAGAAGEDFKQLLEKILKVRERILGADDPGTLESLNNLALILIERGESELAQTLFDRAWESQRRLLGDDHPATLTSLNNLAGCLFKRGDLEGAQSLLEEVVRRRAHVLGPWHPTTLNAVSSLAAILHRRGDFGAAAKLYARVHGALRLSLGPDHLETLSAFRNVARTSSQKADVENKVEMLRQVYEEFARVLGPEHPKTLGSMADLAREVSARGDTQGGRTLLEQVLERQTRVLGQEHPDTLSTMSGLAVVMLEGREDAGARALIERLLEAQMRTLGPDHFDTLATMTKLAMILSMAHEVDSAKALYERVQEALVQTLGPDHPDTITSMDAYSLLLFENHDLETARRVQLRALEAKVRSLGPEHPQTIEGAARLARTLAALDNLDAAIELQERVLEVSTRVLGAENEATLRCLKELGRTFSARGDIEKACGLLQTALEVQSRRLGAEHVDTIAAMVDLAAALYAGDELDAAHALFARVLEAQTRILGAEHPDTLASMENLAGVFFTSGDLDKAQTLQDQAYEARMRLFGADDDLTKTAAANLAAIAAARGG